MKCSIKFASLALVIANLASSAIVLAKPMNSVNSVASSPDLEIRQAQVSYLVEINLKYFE